MIGIIEKWNSEKIRRDNWMRIAVRPSDRAEGRSFMEKFQTWFIQNGAARCMIWVVSYSSYSTIAFSSQIDFVLFRLTFPEMSIGLVPQPHSHEEYKI